ncbi:putative nuclease HARBI1 [Bactrocera tryoni]|uniref:putative nuclease HARBI1 n=1 Tax=Bactrocera tryoni TaxID=59916 RepID=UPI001A97172D|nr:putative nuclease HARBI1 [Bactrocera tryoni]
MESVLASASLFHLGQQWIKIQMTEDDRHTGANHDSFVYNVSYDILILGDAGYPLHKFLLMPFRLAAAFPPQAHYNTVLSKARNIVEHTIVVLEEVDFDLGLHNTPEKATQIVNACYALHNIWLEIIRKNIMASLKIIKILHFIYSL